MMTKSLFPSSEPMVGIRIMAAITATNEIISRLFLIRPLPFALAVYTLFFVCDDTFVIHI